MPLAISALPMLSRTSRTDPLARYLIFISLPRKKRRPESRPFKSRAWNLGRARIPVDVGPNNGCGTAFLPVEVPFDQKCNAVRLEHRHRLSSRWRDARLRRV